MTTDQFVREIELVAGLVADRARGVGAEQYDFGDVQRFETLPLADLIRELLEEVEDSVSYLVQTHIRFRRLLDLVQRLAAVDVPPPMEKRQNEYRQH